MQIREPMRAIRQGSNFGTAIRRMGHRYPLAGYGGLFRVWLFREDAAPEIERHRAQKSQNPFIFLGFRLVLDRTGW